MVPSFILSALALLASTASAQYGYDTGSSSMAASSSKTSSTAAAAVATSAPPTATAPPGQVMVQVVQVSENNGTLAYFPEKVVAPPGSFVQFQFHPKNHTVSQSSFGVPCVPIGVSNTSFTHGIKSGFMPVAANATQLPVFSVLVNDTTPIWIYCGQTGHCQKGMAMVINEVSGSAKNLAAYKAAAASAGQNSTSSTGGATTIQATSTAATPPTATGGSATAATPAKFTGAAAAVAVEGALGVGALLAGLAFAL